MSTCWVVGSVAHCQALLYVIGGSFALGLSSTSLLFFFRVRAIYGNSRIITAFFGFMWVATLGLSGLIPHSIFGDVSTHSWLDPRPKYSLDALSARLSSNWSSTLVIQIDVLKPAYDQSLPYPLYLMPSMTLSSSSPYPTTFFRTQSSEMVGGPAPGHSFWAMDFLDCREVFCKAGSFITCNSNPQPLPAHSDNFFKAWLFGSASSSSLCSLYLIFQLYITPCCPFPISRSKMLWHAASTVLLSWVSSRIPRAPFTALPFHPSTFKRNPTTTFLSSSPHWISHRPIQISYWYKIWNHICLLGIVRRAGFKCLKGCGLMWVSVQYIEECRCHKSKCIRFGK